MAASILVTTVIVLSIAVALRSPHEDRLIARRPFNNPHSDASAAKEGWLG